MFTNHIGIKVKNIDNSQIFYCKNLGFSYDHKYEDDNKILVFLKNENSVLELVYLKDTEYNSVKNGIIDHIAFTVDNIYEYIDKLKNRGVKFISDEVIKIDGKLIVFFEGSEGEKIELVQYLAV